MICCAAKSKRSPARRRYNLQETLAHAIYERVAERRGVRALRVATSKPDVYAKARGVGVEIASFTGTCPDRVNVEECAAAEQNSLRRHYGKDKDARLPPMIC